MKQAYFLFILLISLSCKTNQPLPQQIRSEPDAGLQLNKMDNFEGFFNIYWDNQDGKVWLVIDKLNVEFLYINSLVTGLGSNDIGLDRGQFGDNRVVKFIKNGPRILLVQPNYSFRAISENPFEQKAVDDSFAQSILWGFGIKEQSSGSYIVDATEFFLSDAHNVIGTLARMGQGKYKVDLSKSGINAGNLKNFPENTVVESILTFEGNPEGSYVLQVVPSPEFITVRQRHSFVKLPDPGYSMRRYDSRSGYFKISFYDYAAPFTDPIEKNYIVRHRLIKKEPDQKIGEPIAPIVYYLDPGTPEPVRSALLEGASWWEEAFEAAGFKNAFQVRMLPEDADPMDVRYNTIQWVHRATRGWSYGHSVIDPRTGEIIKGHVSLGSLRIRQDFLIAQGLLSPYSDGGTGLAEAKEMALARIRQLSAHEVGHTLGLVHNYAASVQNRASVMDYPHPLITLTDDGEIDLSEAYDTKIGEWDKQAIKYGYAVYIENEEEGLQQTIQESISNGLYYISDKDARPEGSAHPYAHLWDNNSNAANELNRINEIRKIALRNIGLSSIPDNYPLSTLEDVFVPVYLMHRYQLEAASKLVGGLLYSYAHKGDGQVIAAIVPAETQLMALKAITQTIQPEFLEIPENLLRIIPPKALGTRQSNEHFRKKTGVTFDPLAAAESAAELSIRLLLNPQRTSRLVEYKSRNSDLPGLEDVLNELIDCSWKKPAKHTYLAEINRTVSILVLAKMIQLAEDGSASGQARAITLSTIYDLEKWMQNTYEKENNKGQKAHILYGLELIKRFKENPEIFKSNQIHPLPMGSPIGNDLLNCDF
jgi:hypothetical protein